MVSVPRTVRGVDIERLVAAIEADGAWGGVVNLFSYLEEPSAVLQGGDQVEGGGLAAGGAPGVDHGLLLRGDVG